MYKLHYQEFIIQYQELMVQVALPGVLNSVQVAILGVPPGVQNSDDSVAKPRAQIEE